MAALQPVPQARRARQELTQARLKELLHYDPDTGVFTWRVSVGRVRAGRVAGSMDTDGYLRFTVDGRDWKAHRLAFLYMTGAIPEDDVDHENRKRDDNRWSNLRPATRVQNLGNSGVRADNSSGIKGVSWNKQAGKWLAQITINRRQKYLGYFDDREAAGEAYAAAARQHFGEFARVSVENS